MSANEENGFSKGLGVLVGIVGAIMGVGIANEDPDMNAFLGFIVGGILGYIAGRIAGELLTIVVKVVIGIEAIIFILYRMYRLFSFLSE